MTFKTDFIIKYTKYDYLISFWMQLPEFVVAKSTNWIIIKLMTAVIYFIRYTDFKTCIGVPNFDIDT